MFCTVECLSASVSEKCLWVEHLGDTLVSASLTTPRACLWPGARVVLFTPRKHRECSANSIFLCVFYGILPYGIVPATLAADNLVR
jgi:hypothetical protein